MESISADDARRSLESIGAVRRDVAARLTTPLWYYPALGLLVAQMVVVYGIVRGPVPVLSALVLAAGATLLRRTYDGHTGIVATWPAGRLSAVALVAFASGILVPVSLVCLDYVTSADRDTGAVIGLAALSFVSTALLGPVYDACYRTDLQRGSARGAS